MAAKADDKPQRPGGAAHVSGHDHHGSVAAPDHVVYVVDDDRSVREGLGDLLASRGYHAQFFASAGEYIASPRLSVPGCLVLDIKLPDINGLDLQLRLAGQVHPPIVFITGHGDIPSAVRAIKAGAVDVLPKPFGEDQLLAAINTALTHDQRAKAASEEVEELRTRYDTLTPREKQILPLIVSGLVNKQTAAILGITLVTTQIHRGNIMRKMMAGSLSNLVRIADKLQIPRYQSAASSAKHRGHESKPHE
jgi:FixJ family two-component response regulator